MKDLTLLGLLLIGATVEFSNGFKMMGDTKDGYINVFEDGYYTGCWDLSEKGLEDALKDMQRFLDKKVATGDEDAHVVFLALSTEEKLYRVKNHYPDLDEVLEILGFYDMSLGEEECIKIDSLKGESLSDYVYGLAIENGNFMEPIAYNAQLEI